MSDRIINIHDGPNGDPPKQPVQMEDLINSAELDWKAGHKQKAFITALGALSMISVGTAQAIKTAEFAVREVQALKAKLPKE